MLETLLKEVLKNALDVRVEGQPFLLESTQDLRRLRLYIDRVIDWCDHVSSFPVYSTVVQPADTEPPVRKELPKAQANGTNHTSSITNKKPVATSNPELGKRIIDYVLRSLLARGGSAETKEVYQDALKEGWTTSNEKFALEIIRGSAKKPRYQSLIRRNGTRFILTEAGREAAERLQRGEFYKGPNTFVNAEGDVIVSYRLSQHGEQPRTIRVGEGEDYDWEDSEGNRYKGPQTTAAL